MKLLCLISFAGITLSATAHTSTTYVSAPAGGTVSPSGQDSTAIFLNGKKVTARQLTLEDANTFGDVQVIGLKNGDAIVNIPVKNSPSQEGMVKKPASEDRYFINGKEVAQEEFRSLPEEMTVMATVMYNKETGSKDRYLISTQPDDGKDKAAAEYYVNGRKVSRKKFGKLSASEIVSMKTASLSGITVISVTAE